MIRRWVVNIAVVLVAVVAGFWQYSQNSQAKRALCAFRLDLEVRIDNSRKYLDDLDTGKREPIPGITRVDIVTSLQNQERTIKALSSLDCS